MMIVWIWLGVAWGGTCTQLENVGSTYLFCDDEQTWVDAADACATLGFHLVQIDDALENDFVDASSDDISEDYWWLGLNDRAVEDTFVWDGGGVSGYLNWQPGQPNANGEQDCTNTNIWDDGTWNDADCDEESRYVCELECAPTPLYYADADGDGFGDPDVTIADCVGPPAGFVNDSSDCDDMDAGVRPGAVDICDGVDNDCDGGTDPGCNCIENSYGDSTYLFCDEAFTWSSARDLCAGFGADWHLVEVDNALEDVLVDTFADLLNPGPWWLGYNDILVEGSFVWDGPNVSVYTNWRPGQPNDSGNQDCTNTNVWDDGTWNDASCDEFWPYICERNCAVGGVEVCGDGIDSDCDGLGGPTDDEDGDGLTWFEEDSVGASDCDQDSDGDGIADDIEFLAGDTDLDGMSDIVDEDDDNDGIPTAEEGTGNAETDFPCDGIEVDDVPNYLDSDSDGDGASDADEGSGDADGDGLEDYLDCSLDEVGDSDGDGLSDVVEQELGTDPDSADSDDDGVDDVDELGGDAINPEPIDTDGDGLIDAVDDDDDGDSVPTREEDVDGDGDPRNDDTDDDGVPNYLDTDSDGDGVDDAVEGTADRDCDGIDDMLDAVDDGSDACLGELDTDDGLLYGGGGLRCQVGPAAAGWWLMLVPLVARR